MLKKSKVDSRIIRTNQTISSSGQLLLRSPWFPVIRSVEEQMKFTEQVAQLEATGLPHEERNVKLKHKYRSQGASELAVI